MFNVNSTAGLRIIAPLLPLDLLRKRTEAADKTTADAKETISVELVAFVKVRGGVAWTWYRRRAQHKLKVSKSGYEGQVGIKALSIVFKHDISNQFTSVSCDFCLGGRKERDCTNWTKMNVLYSKRKAIRSSLCFLCRRKSCRSILNGGVENSEVQTIRCYILMIKNRVVNLGRGWNWLFEYYPGWAICHQSKSGN